MLIAAGCTTQEKDTTADAGMPVPDATGSASGTESVVVKTFVVTGGNFWFEMEGTRAPEIRVNEGDTVRIEFTSVEGYHDWVVDEFGAATAKVRDTDEDPSTFVEFVADKKGTYEYYCSVGQHRANGMVGNLVVE